jgi:hypothetical protein
MRLPRMELRTPHGLKGDATVGLIDERGCFTASHFEQGQGNDGIRGLYILTFDLFSFS